MRCLRVENKEKNFVSAVVYIHNSQDYIEEFLENVMNVLETNFGHSEIICVNDASDDKSADIVRSLSQKAKTTSISLLNMSFFHGLELAMNAGVDLAIGDFVFEFDTPILDFNSEEIMRVYKHALEGYDIVSASPNRKQKLSSSIFYKVFNKFADFSYKMCTESFRILSRRVINRVSSMNKSIPYRKAVYANCGLKTDNLVYEVVGSKQGIKANRRDNKYRRGLASDTLILFTQIGYKFAMLMTKIMMFITIAMAVYALVAYVMLNPIQGWTTTILFLSFAFTGIFAIMTIVIKYLQIIVNLVFKRKQYSFESIEKLTK